MKALNEYLKINETIRVGKGGKKLIDLNKFDEIVKNLRFDNSKYFGMVGELTDDVSIDSVENTSVWGEYDAPVNKVFDRGYKVDIDFKKGDQVILIYDYINRDEEDSGIKNLYICKFKDVWYYLNRSDADDFMECIKSIKINKPEL